MSDTESDSDLDVERSDSEDNLNVYRDHRFMNVRPTNLLALNKQSHLLALKKLQGHQVVKYVTELK